MQVVKFAIYVAIPVTLTFYVAQNPDLLSSIIKNVRDLLSGAAHQASQLRLQSRWHAEVLRGVPSRRQEIPLPRGVGKDTGEAQAEEGG